MSYSYEDREKFISDIYYLEIEKERCQKDLASVANEEEAKQLEQKIEAIDVEIDEMNFKKSNVSTTL